MSYAIGLIHAEKGVYGISFPDFPGCISTGRSIDEAMAKGAQALALHVAGMIEDGEPLSILRSADELRADPEFAVDFDGATIVAVPVELPRRAVRVNISIDEGLLERLKMWRREAADGKPAFVVFTDATLELIAEHKPADLGALGRISGVGPAKLEQHGEAVLRLVAENS